MTNNAQPYQPAAPASDRYNVLAIVGFILAFVVNIGGLVVSIIALNQIKKTGERGRGLALAGVIISALSLIIGIISIIVFASAAANMGTTTGY
ncbi:DUF4190 domain-containing protein [Curtobacterium luteum]|uniref:DUF4190 domain-containing protein n=1 Tax=Curtobacterium luteum TaxID=33881 RepID=UPI00382E8673